MSAEREVMERAMTISGFWEFSVPDDAGNRSATIGVEATCEFSIRYRTIHAPDERIEASSLGMVYLPCRKAVRQLHGQWEDPVPIHSGNRNALGFELTGSGKAWV